MPIYIQTYNSNEYTTIAIVADVITDKPMLKQSSISIYPQPVEKTLHINGIDTQCKCSIMSIDGRCIYSEMVPNGAIDVSHLQTGTYLLSIATPQATDIVRFIKK